MTRQLLNLGPRGLHAFDPADDTVVTCTEGSVWVTLDDDVRDIVLERGESFTAPAGRRAVVYAFEVSVVALRARATQEDATPAVRRGRTTAQVAV